MGPEIPAGLACTEGAKYGSIEVWSSVTREESLDTGAGNETRQHQGARHSCQDRDESERQLNREVRR